MPTIRELRLKLDISQSALAKLAGLSDAAISNAERGKPVQRATVAKIAEALNTSPDQLSNITYHSAVQVAARRRPRTQQKPR